ncbi:MAG: PIN domain-containing protein [Candidatus Omnitrophota bacterium]
MTVGLIRVFFLVLSSICGYYFGAMFTGFTTEGAIIGALVGFTSGTILILVEIKLKQVSLRNLSAAAFGLIFGFFMAWMVTLIVRLIPMEEIYYSVAQIIATLIFCYLGMVITIKGKDEFNLIVPYVQFSREEQRDQLFLLDTSAIIDGRIAGICEAGFLEGKLVIPRFVLMELQHIADSADDIKRGKGRRGLDMLDKIKTISGTEVIIHDERLPDIKEVDAKLLRLAKMFRCKVLTTDFNLSKVAKIEGVKVLNVNDLANAIRPVVSPGELMTVYVKKEGKEKNQGVAFMDDGTMIVVDNARKVLGKSVQVSVTSVLQTSAGRMIFAGLVEKPGENRNGHNNVYKRP